jgi:hypothetical protein
VDEQPMNREQRRASARRARRMAALGSAGALVASGAALITGSLPASAAPFEVTNLNPNGAGSLDQAIQDANAAGGADTITFAPGLTGTIDQTTNLTDVLEDVDIQGPGAGVITVDGGDSSELFRFVAGAASTISGLTITNGATSGGGGGIFVGDGDLAVARSVISSSTSGQDGGGLYCNNDGTVTIDATTITGNTAHSAGGGLYADSCDVNMSFSTVSGNHADGDAGGLYLDGNDLIRNTTISGNTADGSAGGLYVSSDTGETVTIVNSTISGNTAADEGGGLYLEDGQLIMIESTVTGNIATTTGGLYSDSAGAADAQEQDADKAEKAGGGDVKAQADDDLVLTGTIIAGNTGFDLKAGGTGGQILSTNSLLGNVEPTTIVHDQGGTLTGVDPLLGPLADNGGPTQTHALLAGSPAIDTGPDPVPDFPGNTEDQRGTGFPRVVNGRVDIGAFELQPIVLEPDFTG